MRFAGSIATGKSETTHDHLARLTGNRRLSLQCRTHKVRRGASGNNADTSAVIICETYAQGLGDDQDNLARVFAPKLYRCGS